MATGDIAGGQTPENASVYGVFTLMVNAVRPFRVLLRLPDFLGEAVDRQRKRQRVSRNQYIALSVAKHAGYDEALEDLSDTLHELRDGFVDHEERMRAVEQFLWKRRGPLPRQPPPNP